MYGKKKMMGGGKMPKPMMEKGGKMSALVIMAKPAKKAAAGAKMGSVDPEIPGAKKAAKKAAKEKLKRSVDMTASDLVKKGMSVSDIKKAKKEGAIDGKPYRMLKRSMRKIESASKKVANKLGSGVLKSAKENMKKDSNIKPMEAIMESPAIPRPKLMPDVMPKKEMKKGGYMKKGGKMMAKGGSMMKSKAPATFAPKSAKNVKGPSPKMAKGGKMKSC